jgi:guanylate kinase
MKRVQEEIARKALFMYTITNDELEKAYNRFRETISEIRRNSNGKNNC